MRRCYYKVRGKYVTAKQARRRSSRDYCPRCGKTYRSLGAGESRRKPRDIRRLWT